MGQGHACRIPRLRTPGLACGASRKQPAAASRPRAPSASRQLRLQAAKGAYAPQRGPPRGTPRLRFPAAAEPPQQRRAASLLCKQQGDKDVLPHLVHPMKGCASVPCVPCEFVTGFPLWMLARNLCQRDWRAAPAGEPV